MLDRGLIQRPRRLRTSARLRDLVAETRIHADRLVQPHFVRDGRGNREEISSMPGIHRETLDTLMETVEKDLEIGVRNVLLFGLSDHKDASASAATAEDALVSRAVAALDTRFGDELTIATDVCLCAYTDHGHCGVLEHGEILNDASLPLLAEMALSHARAGADIVAPSDMMDGRVAAIRSRLDEEGLTGTAIMSYAVKYASSYYGPFRDAADSAPASGDRRSYQMDVRNAREALREALTDEDEGADMLMVKPALAYLDVIHRVRELTALPLAAYNVSGEYSMVKVAARDGLADERALVLENLTAIARAGADILITYHARDVLEKRWL
jgi:porphobilinogen synthase